MNGHGPFLRCLPQSEKQQLQRRLFVGKSATGFDDLAERAVQRLHAVGRVNRSPEGAPRFVDPERYAGASSSIPRRVQPREAGGVGLVARQMANGASEV